MRKEGGGVGEGEADRHGINQAVYTRKGKQADKQARRRTERVEITLAIPQKKKGDSHVFTHGETDQRKDPSPGAQ